MDHHPCMYPEQQQCNKTLHKYRSNTRARSSKLGRNQGRKCTAVGRSSHTTSGTSHSHHIIHDMACGKNGDFYFISINIASRPTGIVLRSSRACSYGRVFVAPKRDTPWDSLAISCSTVVVVPRRLDPRQM